jgi:hypothetical protein
MSYQEIDLEAFCAWLCEHEEEVVGQGGAWFDCPLARWLWECSGHRYGIDGWWYWRAACDEVQWLLPRWAQLLVAYLEHASGCPLTGYEVLVVLARVELMLKGVRSTCQAAERERSVCRA